MILQKLLLDRGGIIRKYIKNQSIFFEGDMPGFYYQIVQGSIRMVNVNERGREFIQGIFKNGESFGEPVLLIDEPYPASAVANEDTMLIKISKEEFLKILKESPEILFQFAKIMAQRVYNKSLIAKAISINKPEHRVLSIFKILKDTYNPPDSENYKVELSRQQIADMTGLRVETVIRTIRKLQEKEVIKILKGKIYL
jgi:CRP/FNR family transcriptional regulator, cyclic AMP receptor protein